MSDAEALAAAPTDRALRDAYATAMARLAVEGPEAVAVLRRAFVARRRALSTTAPPPAPALPVPEELRPLPAARLPRPRARHASPAAPSRWAGLKWVFLAVVLVSGVSRIVSRAREPRGRSRTEDTLRDRRRKVDRDLEGLLRDGGRAAEMRRLLREIGDPATLPDAKRRAEARLQELVREIRTGGR